MWLVEMVERLVGKEEGHLGAEKMVPFVGIIKLKIPCCLLPNHDEFLDS